MSDHERRLSDRIDEALDLALKREELEVAEHLARALEKALTRFGGAGMVGSSDYAELHAAGL